MEPGGYFEDIVPIKKEIDTHPSIFTEALKRFLRNKGCESSKPRTQNEHI
jgi:uncharacterized protein YneF (UPF0154 family)